jgi:glycosyltransferase involved in cell wall biosynthesis
VDAFAKLIESEGIQTVYSIGSGGGVFEYFLKKKVPHVKIIASEWKKAGAERLRHVFLECDEVIVFDALNPEDWKKIGADKNSIVFIYRNEHEFTDEEWHRMIRMMHEAGIMRIFLGIMYLLTIWAYVQAKARNVKKRLRGERLVFVGYLRNYAGFKRFWKGMYTDSEVPFPNCRGFYLKRN